MMCCYMIVPTWGKYFNASSKVIWMNKDMVAFRWKLKYLEVSFDVNLSWMLHLNSIQKKAFKVLLKMSHLSAVNWGLRPIVCKTIYSAVAHGLISGSHSVQ